MPTSISLFQYHSRSISKVTVGNFIMFGRISIEYFVNILVIFPQITQYCDFWPKSVDVPLKVSNFGKKSQYYVIWGKITIILTKWLPEMILNMIKIPNLTLEIYLLWYRERCIDLEVSL